MTRSKSSRSAAKGSSKLPKQQQSSLQRAGSVFVDELGKSAINKLKAKLGLNTELHVVDVPSGSSVLGATLGQIQGAITVPQGTTNATRVGDSIRVVSWEQYISVRQNTTNATPQRARFIGFYNRHNAPATSPVAATQILADATDANSPIAAEFAQAGYQLVFDEVVDLAAGTGLTLGVQGSFRKIWRPQDVHMTWTQGDTTGVQANLVEGGLYVYAFRQDLGTALAAPTYYITSRLTFVDN